MLLLIEYYLWSHPTRGAFDLTLRHLQRMSPLFGSSEVGNLDDAVVGNETVASFHVPVGNAMAVQVLQSTHQLHSIRRSYRFVERAEFIYELADGPPRNILEEYR
jgi:hypothetical protein